MVTKSLIETLLLPVEPPLGAATVCDNAGHCRPPRQALRLTGLNRQENLPT